MKYFFYLFIASVLFISCDEEMVPMKEREVPPGNKVVLVEDYTGVRCIACPAGARLIEGTRTTPELKKRILPIAIHTDFLGNPYPNSKYDFRTPKGQAMQEYVGSILGKPAATINRTPSGTPTGIFYGVPNTWPDFIVQELARPTELNMTISLEYNASNRTVSAELTFIPVDDIDFPLNITTIIAESDLVDPQLDNPGVKEDYVHNHVLRDVLSSIQGDPLGASFDKGGIYKKTYTYAIPPEDQWWVAENCEIIAFVSNSDTKRILQAISKDVVE